MTIVTRWMSEVLRRVEARAMGRSPALPPTFSMPSPPPRTEFQDNFQAMVRSIAEDLKKRIESGKTVVPPPPPAEIETVAPQPAPATAVQEPEPLPATAPAAAPSPTAAQTPEPVPPTPPAPQSAEELPSLEDRQALESALGLGPSPAAEAPLPEDIEQLVRMEMSKPVLKGAPPPQPPPAPHPARAAPAPEPVRPSRIDLTTPPLPPAVSKPKILAAHLLTFCWTALIRVLTMLDRLAPAPIQARKTLLGRIGIGVGALATLGLFWLAYSRFGK